MAFGGEGIQTKKSPNSILGIFEMQIRGGIIIKNGKIADFFPNRGGGQKKTKKSGIQIRTFENPWEGGLNFSKMSEL